MDASGVCATKRCYPNPMRLGFAALLGGVLCLPLLTACQPDEGGESGDDGDVFEPPDGDDFGIYARGGIRLSKVTADQAVAIELGASGNEIEPGDRQATLIEGRPLLIRALFELPDDWEPREITARIVLHFPDGSSEDATQTIMVEEEPQERWLDTGFFWALPGEFAQPGLQYDISLYEAGDAPDGAEPAEDAEGFPRLPREGSADLGVSEGYRVIDVLLVPVDHQFEGGKDPENCQLEEFPQEKVEAFRAALQAHNPVTNVTMATRDEPLIFEESAQNLGVLLDELSMLREVDGAKPNTYYYGIINPCDWGSSAGFAGQARRPDEITKELAHKRVAVGDVGVSLNATIDTFVHEVGHNQGFQHVPCTGNEGNPVDDYPVENGLIGSFGFDFDDWEIKLPTHADYMSYCGPSWASHYSWEKALPVIETLSSWDLEDNPDPEGHMLIGSMHENGTETWWVARGNVSQASDETVDVLDAEGHWRALPAMVDDSDEHGSFVMVNLPASMDAQLVRHGGHERTVRHPTANRTTK